MGDTWRTNERPGTDHVTSGPMKGLKKMHPMAHREEEKKQANGHGDYMTVSAQSDQFSENRSEGRRVGKECTARGRSRWPP